MTTIFVRNLIDLFHIKMFLKSEKNYLRYLDNWHYTAILLLIIIIKSFFYFLSKYFKGFIDLLMLHFLSK